MQFGLDQIVGMCFVLIAAFFFIRVGTAMHNGGEGTKFWAWVAGLIMLFYGFSQYTEIQSLNEIEAFFILMCLLPVISYIATFLIEAIGSYKMQQRVRAGFLSGAGGVISYLAGYSLFGFGIPEASLAAAVAAITLGLLGFTA